jgi:D-alanine transaminase
MIVFLNGKFVDKEKVQISPDDRGFLFGDGLYEVVLAYNGRPFRLEDHIARLRQGCEFARINLKYAEDIHEICLKLIDKNNLKDAIGKIYIQVTRGVYKRAHRFPPDEVPPTLYISAIEFIPNHEHQKNGIKAITVPDDRWEHCDIKTIDLLPNVLAHQKAVDQGGSEAIFVRDGILLEGTHSNFFAVKEGKVIIAPESDRILSGVTRRAVFEICRKLNIDLLEEPIKESILNTFEEAFITSTTLEITPVVLINDLKIGSGNPGSITRLIQEEYHKLVHQEHD